jgi:glycosyltransferase involved in cell wall biosynthesis
MRILQLCNKPPYPPRDGGSLAMFNLADSLVILGHNVSVLTMFTNKHGLTIGQHQEFSKFMPVHTVYVDTSVHVPGIIKNMLFSEKPYTSSRFSSPVFHEKLIQLLKTEEFDIIQLEGLYLAPYITTIRNNCNAKIALRAHNVEHEIWERIAMQEKNFFRKSYFRLLSKRIRILEFRVLNKYDMLIPITNRDLDKFNRMGNTKPAHVCPAGVNIEKKSFGNDTSSWLFKNSDLFSLFYLGSLDWIPNQEGLLWFVTHVFPKLRRKHPILKLHVAGRNAPSSIIKQLELPGIVFYGEIEDAHNFMKAHTILVAPCFSGSGMRLKIIEAMAMGRPVVTTSIGTEGLSVVHGEHIMIADTDMDFLDCIDKLMKYPERCEKIGHQAYNFVYDHYRNPDIASSLASFYNQQL